MLHHDCHRGHLRLHSLLVIPRVVILAFNSNRRECAESLRFLSFCSSPFIRLGDKRMEELTAAKKDYEKALEEGVAGIVNCSL